MTILLYVVAAFFGLISFGATAAYVQSRHVGALLGGLVFGAAAIAAVAYVSWWPLLAGFVLAWLLRQMGLDPGAR